MYKNNMRKIRTEQGIKLKVLAEETKISIGYLSHLEKGNRKNPSAKVMEKISKSLKKSISEIFFNE